MKKILLSMIAILIFSCSYSYAAFTMDDTKYISEKTAEELWGTELKLNDRTGIIEVKHEDKTIFIQLGKNVVKKEENINRLFLNIDGYELSGESTNAYPVIMDGQIYIPYDILYDLVFEENEYDIIVVGCDPEGIASAVSASRMGAKVLLIGQEETPGGLLVHGMLNTLDMNWDDKTLLTQGIFEEFFDYIGRTESFDVNKAEQFFTEIIDSEKNLTYLSGINNFNPIVEEKVIKGIEIENAGLKQSYYSKIMIDATQDGDVCALAGVPYYEGMEDINILDSYMAVTLVFKVSGVDWNELGQDVYRYQRETGDMNSGINASSVWAFGKWCYNNYTAIDDNIKLRGLNIGRQDDGTLLINALQILGVNGLDKEAVNTAMQRGEREIYNVLDYLKTKLNSFANAEIAGIADELYIRETRHIKGEYTVQASELLEGVIFTDAIAAGSYPLDIQTTSMSDSGYVIGVPERYTIPYRSIVPLEIDNLYIVGKCGSYSSVAAGSIRVVPVGMAVGESAGIASVYSIKNNITPREIIGTEAINDIQKIIVDRGGYIPEYSSSKKIVNTKYYEEFIRMFNLGLLPGGYGNEFNLKKEITQSGFINMIFRTMKREGIDKNIDKLNEKVSSYYSDDNLTYQKASEILFKIKGKNVKEKNAFMYASKECLFSGLVNEMIYADNVITNEIAYKIICDFIDTIH